jgi:hypothetical protein
MISKLISFTQSLETMEILLSEHNEMIGDDDKTIEISRDTLPALMINNDTSKPLTVVLHSYR